MPTIPTDHELRLEAEERERTYTKRVRERRNELMRLCPNGRALDRDHVVELIGQQWSSNVIYLHARRFVAAGMLAHGYNAGLIARGLGIATTDVAEVAGKVEWWDPPAALLADLPDEYRGRVVGPR